MTHYIFETLIFSELTNLLKRYERINVLRMTRSFSIDSKIASPKPKIWDPTKTSFWK